MKGVARSNADKRKYPLRRVIERDIEGEYKGTQYDGANGKWLNKLECGHLVPPAKDFYGEIFSVKQRCRLCHDELNTK